MRRAHDVERPSSVVAEEMRLLKPSASELQGKAHKFDTVAAIKRRNDHGVFFRWSKRKKRFIDESTGGEWNDGKDDGGRYDKDRRARARRYTINRASVRLFNKRRGLEGKGPVRLSAGWLGFGFDFV